MLKLQYFGHLMQKTMKKMGKKMNRLIVRTAAETEAPILWAPEAKSQLIGKDPDAGKEGLRAGGEGGNRG